MKESGIYRIRNIVNNKIYVGSSSDIKSRWYKHKSMLRGGKHHTPYLQNSWNKYGEESFVIEIIELCEDFQLLEREQYHIDILNPEFNYMKVAGSTRGYHHKEETRKYLSDKMIGNKNCNPESVRKTMIGNSNGLGNKGNRNHKKVKCPHCGKVANYATMIQWHFDKCKLATK